MYEPDVTVCIVCWCAATLIMETLKMDKALAATHQRLRQGDGLLAVVAGEEEYEGAVDG